MNVTRRQRWLAVSLAVVLLVVVAILVAVHQNVLTTEDGALLMSGVLAVATFTYVLLAFDMVSTMREQMQQSKELFKLRRKDDVIRLIQNQIHPLTREISEHKHALKGRNNPEAYDTIDVNGTWYRRLPRLSTEFDRSVEPAALSKEVGVDAGDTYMYFHKVNEYIDTYDRAVTNLSIAILDDIDNLPIQPDGVEDIAESALSIEPIGVSRNHWNRVIRDIVPYRDEITGLTDELLDLLDDIKRLGHDVRMELDKAEIELRREHYISQSDLESNDD